MNSTKSNKKTADANLTGDFTSALKPVNKSKNRYKNILPFEHTRVKLEPLEGKDGSDFVSANYVSGEIPGSEKAYICTQGPLASTCEDYWRMIWEQNSNVMCMLAKLREMGKEKVYPYWPEAEPFQFNLAGRQLLEVSILSEKEEQYWIRRDFQLLNKNTGEKRAVIQFHFHSWPDQGCPDDPVGFVKLVVEVNKVASKVAPLIVHCSAGIGRTGTFCVVHATYVKLKLLLNASYPLKFDIKQTLLDMRSQRAGMVQTKEQYEFCYISLKEKLNTMMKLLEYKNELYVHKKMTPPEANDALRGKPHGSFLFRGSSEPGFIVVSAVNHDQIMHARIVITDEGFKLENELHPTLDGLVKSKKQVLIHPVLRKN